MRRQIDSQGQVQWEVGLEHKGLLVLRFWPLKFWDFSGHPNQRFFSDFPLFFTHFFSIFLATYAGQNTLAKKVSGGGGEIAGKCGGC